MQDTESRSVVSLATEAWSRRKWIGLLLFAGPMAATISMTLSLMRNQFLDSHMAQGMLTLYRNLLSRPRMDPVAQ